MTESTAKASKVEAVKVENKNNSKVPSFISIEEYKGGGDALAVYNGNPAYKYRWCEKTKMVGNRRDIWHAVDKTHPDFEGLKVGRDETPDLSTISFGDVMLCCARKETADSKRKFLDKIIPNRDKKFEAHVQEVTDRICKEGPKGLSSKTEQLMAEQEEI